MKYAYVLAIVLPAALLVGCNMQNNGETPPPNELPTPYQPLKAPTGPSAATTPTPAATQNTTTTAAPGAAAPTQPAASAAATPANYTYAAAKGKQVYSSTCSVCHKPTGVGIVGTFPPLKGNPVVNNPDATEQIQIVLSGTHGAKTIEGVKYNGVMPPLGAGLSNEQIANLVNYERSSWGNHAKHTTPAQVAKVRAGGK